MHPYVRIIFLLLSIIGVVLSVDIRWLGLYGLILVIINIIDGRSDVVVNFIFICVLPMIAMQSIMHFLIIKGTIIQFKYIMFDIARLVALTNSIIIGLSLKSEEVVYTLKKLKLRGKALIIALGTYTVILDIVNRADRIITARLSRGYVDKRNTVNSLLQIPYILVPLIIGVFRTTIERSESWDQKDMFEVVKKINVESPVFRRSHNLFMLFISIGWIILNLLLLWAKNLSI